MSDHTYKDTGEGRVVTVIQEQEQQAGAAIIGQLSLDISHFSFLGDRSVIGRWPQ